MNRAVIALGSNIEPQANIDKALKELNFMFNVLAESEFVKTAPLGNEDQDEFINGAILVATVLSQPHLARRLKELEAKLGRTPSDDKNGPRVIDLDIVVYDDKVVDQDVHEREFLKKSVQEVLPEISL